MHEITKPNNQILVALPKNEYQNLLPDLEKFDLIFSENIYEPGARITHVYFPESGIISLLSAVEEQTTLEVGIVGNEGIVGLSIFLGVETSINCAVVQGAGTALRITTANFLKAAKSGGKLPQLLQRYTHSLLTQISQSAVCNRYHKIVPRMARWLLMSQDRMQADEFQITQEFLSNMLGVRREGVNKAAMYLQQENLISYSRGNLLILNRKGMEQTACACYRIIKKESDNFQDVIPQ